MKKISLIFLSICGFILVVGIVAAFAGWQWLFSPVAANDTITQTIVITRGQTTAEVAQKLTESNLIRHPLAFRLAVLQQNLEGKLQAGTFKLQKSQNPAEIAQALTKATSDLWVTLPEGLRVEEIAEVFGETSLSEFDQAEFLELAKPAEGRLFPDTYLVPQQSTAGAIFRLLTFTFDKKISTDLAEEISISDRSFEDLLIMASLLEREAQGEADMRHVAGILWNRIDLGMPLQVDATLQYAKGQNATGKWWSPPLGVDRRIDSPYNTYTNAGLPPGPISNPGVAAFRAALNPQETDDLFYLHDASSKIHYAQTLNEHQHNIDTYLR